MSRKRLSILFLVFAMILTFSVPVFASYDGGVIVKVTASSFPIRTGAGTGYGLVMTSSNAEALVDLQEDRIPDSSNNVWAHYKGWKYTTSSIVSGYGIFQNSSGTYNVTSLPIDITVKTPSGLNLYNLETDQTYNAVIPSGSKIIWDNKQAFSYSGMAMLRIADWYDPSNVYHTVSSVYPSGNGVGYVHTNFRTSSPSNYYVNLIGN